VNDGWQIVGLVGTPDEARRRQLTSEVALALGVPLGEARAYLAARPQTWPLRTDAATLAELGLEAKPYGTAPTERCAAHERLGAERRCSRCDAAFCSVCAAVTAQVERCATCHGRHGRRRRFFHLRLAVLLAILGVVLLYAYSHHRRLEKRTTWTETLEVAIVVIPQGAIDGDVLDEFTSRGQVLEHRLTEERRRHAPQSAPPFRITTYVAQAALPAPPALPDDIDTLTGLVTYTWDKQRWVSQIDDAVGLHSGGLDARIYLVARPVEDGLPRTVEGVGEENGTIGIVEIDLSDDTVDLAHFVAAHELFHLLGADDRYGPTGDILVPQGLAEPELEPRYPQRFTEIMARHRAISESQHVLPEGIEELRVGQITARELGWLQTLSGRRSSE